jgi:hypothetical protein
MSSGYYSHDDFNLQRIACWAGQSSSVGLSSAGPSRHADTG